jgi:hypothetical protein
MTIEFTTANKESPVVEFTYPVDELQSLFDDCQTWKSDMNLQGLKGYNGLSKRLMRKYGEIPSLKFDNFSQELEKSRLSLINKFLEIDTRDRWPNIPEQINNRMNIYNSLIVDLKGFNMAPHIDNRTVYAAGYINIFDNESLTVISSTKKSIFGKTSGYQAPGEKGRGVIWLNTESSWHWVNKVSRDRKILMMSFQIVPWD